MPNDAHVLDLLPAFVLDSLDSDESSQVQEHLLSCLICRAEADSYQEVSAQIGLLAPAGDPSPDLKERLMTRVQATRPKPRVEEKVPARPLLERLLPAWGLASLVLVLALGAVNLFLWQRLDNRDAFTAPGGMRAVPLSPEDAASDATGFVLVSADGEDGALVVDGLPPLDESQEYQVWLIRNGERTSGALFTTDENNYGGTRIRAPRSLLDYSSVGITIEPVGGSPQPTGERVLGGPLMLP
jgi:anti-sigma-K factor RskA